MSNGTSDRTALLGIGGGVAAYKAVTVASRLHQAGISTYVAMTEAARKFVTPLTFAAVTNQRVLIDIFSGSAGGRCEDVYPHLYPATRADLFIALPATADLIAALAQGLGDDIVRATALSLPMPCRRYFCPAMNVEMWHQSVVQDNVRRLQDLGWQRIGPESGHLGCGTEGEGRMTEAEAIVERIMADLSHDAELEGRRVLILSGPTIEAIDPVRFISNHSSGKMGRALAEAAVAAGSDVDFVSGPVPDANLPSDPRIHIRHVSSAEQMLRTAQELFPASDAAVFVAAVADYRPATTTERKIAKNGEPLSLELMPTPDIAAALCAGKRDDQVCIGFALETHDGLRSAQEKLEKKNLDAIVLNAAEAIADDAADYTFISSPTSANWGRLEKTECARRVVGKLAEMLGLTARTKAMI